MEPSPPSKIEVQIAKAILKAQAKHRAFMCAKCIELITLLSKTERAATISFHAGMPDVESISIELYQPDVGTFTVYDFSDIQDIKEGLKLMRGYIEKGIGIPFYSMNDKRHSERS